MLEFSTTQSTWHDLWPLPRHTSASSWPHARSWRLSLVAAVGSPQGPVMTSMALLMTRLHRVCRRAWHSLWGVAMKSLETKMHHLRTGLYCNLHVYRAMEVRMLAIFILIIFLHLLVNLTKKKIRSLLQNHPLRHYSQHWFTTHTYCSKTGNWSLLTKDFSYQSCYVSLEYATLCRCTAYNTFCIENLVSGKKCPI